MATYIPGVTDYIPQIQPFQPDYNFLGNIMQTRQSRYDAAHKQLSSVYGTLLNSPMLREENIRKRDEFFKSIDGDIKRIAGLDLSLKQNQDAAMQVFKPFYEDKDMVKDMVWTKNYNNQLSRAEQFKYCVDPDKCGGSYWEGGVKALQYKALEFKNASRDEAMQFENASFTPSVNVMDKAMKAAKEAGFKVSFDSVKGGYIVTDKNGERMVAPLTSFFMSKFGGDPAVMAYYKTQAYNQRKEYIAQNAGRLGEDQAALEYMKSVYQGVTERIEKDHTKSSQNKDRINIFLAAAQQQASEKGVLPSDTKLMSAWQSLKEQQAIADQNHEVVKGAVDNLNATKHYTNNAKMMGDHLDNLVGFAMLSKEAGNAAKAYADLTSERDIKADPYSLAAYQSNLDFQKQVKLKNMDLNIWKEKEKIKAAQQHAQAERQFGSTFLPDAKGTATPIKDENLALKENLQAVSELFGGNRANSSEFVKGLAAQLKTQYQISAKDPVKQNALVATAELIFKGTGIDGKKIANGDLKELSKLNALDPAAASKVYEQGVKVIDPSTTTGMINSDWSKDFWYNTAKTRAAIDFHKKNRGDALQFFQEQAHNVTEGVKAEIMNKDKSLTGNLKAALMEEIADLSHNGFLPVINEGSQSLKNIANDFANKYQKQLGGWTNAYSFALQHGEDLSAQWYNGYKNYAKAYNQLEGFGKTANAKMSGAYQYEYDSAVPSHNNSVRLNEFLQNTRAAGSEAIIQFGDAGAISGDDPLARQILDQFTTDFSSVNPKHPDAKRPKGTYTAQRIGGANDNYMAYTVHLDQNYIDKYKGSAKVPGITGGLTAGSDITVFIPKDKANNSFYQDTKYDIYDHILNKHGEITIDNIPNAGTVKFTKVDGGIMATGYFEAVSDEKGTLTKVPVNNIMQDIDASTAYETVMQEMINLSRANEAQLAMLRSKYGTKTLGQ